MRLVLPSLMNREDLETKFSKLSLYLACCSRLAQQMEELAESMRKNIELHKVLSNNKTDLLAAKQEIIEDLTKQLNDKIKKLREDWWYTEQARTLEKMGHLRNPDKALTCGDWADACSLDAAIESLRSEGEQR